MPIELSKEEKRAIYDALQAYFDEHFDLDIGDLQSEMLVDLFVAHVGATIYNGAIRDAQAYMQGKLIDLEIDLHE